MPRYALTVAYDGTDFCGWQKQEPLHAATRTDPSLFLASAPTDTLEAGRVQLRTVQAVLERSVREAVREPVVLTGASRTDAGVHAMGQVAAFTCSGGEGEGARAGADAGDQTGDHTGDQTGKQTSAQASLRAELHHGPHAVTPQAGRGTGWPASRGCERLIRAINSRLPADVLVLHAREVPHDFDPVRWAVRKQYVYTFRTGSHRPLFDRDRVFGMHDTLDIARMQRASTHLLGTHDCLGLTSMHHGRLTTVRTIEACEVSRVRASESTLLPDVEPQADIVQVRVRGTGFLYNMVRIIAGTLLDVGRGRLSEDVFARIYETRDRRLAGQTLPPNGLCLEWIEHATSKPAMLETGALETGADETGADGAGVDETGRENRE